MPEWATVNRIPRPRDSRECVYISPKVGGSNQDFFLFLWHCVSVLPLPSRRLSVRKMSNTSAPAIRTRLDAVHGCRAEDVRGCLWYNHEEGETKEVLSKRGARGGSAGFLCRGCRGVVRGLAGYLFVT